MGGDHSIVIAPAYPTALRNDPAIGKSRWSVKRQYRQTAQQNLQSSLPYSCKSGVPVDTPLQFGKAQGGQQHVTVMLRQLGKNCVGAVAGMDGDIGVDKISQDRTTASIPPTQRNIDRLPLFDAGGLWHAAQGCDSVLQTVASGKNCDHVTQTCDFKIDVGIRVGKLSRNANRLAVARFEHAGPGHRGLVPKLSEFVAAEATISESVRQSMYIRSQEHREQPGRLAIEQIEAALTALHRRLDKQRTDERPSRSRSSATGAARKP
jgi:hypothetical protein